MLNETGIKVVDQEEAETEAEGGEREEEETSGDTELVEVASPGQVRDEGAGRKHG
jgi:hypothetical protein